MTDLAALRARHFVEPAPDELPRCFHDSEEWPCDAAQLLALLAAEVALHAETWKVLNALLDEKRAFHARHVHRVYSAVGATPAEPAALDVGLLAEAMDRADTNYSAYGWTERTGMAAAIAAEYAALRDAP